MELPEQNDVCNCHRNLCQLRAFSQCAQHLHPRLRSCVGFVSCTLGVPLDGVNREVLHELDAMYQA